MFFRFLGCSSSTRFDRVRIPSFLPGEPMMLILGFFTLFRVFELSCFRDGFSSSIHGNKKSKGGSRKHEITKVRKNAICFASGLPTPHPVVRVVSRPRTLLCEGLPTPHSLGRNKTGTGSELQGACPVFVPSNNEPPLISPQRLMPAGAIRI